jgi:hypothetical protein
MFEDITRPYQRWRLLDLGGQVRAKPSGRVVIPLGAFLAVLMLKFAGSSDDD